MSALDVTTCMDTFRSKHESGLFVPRTFPPETEVWNLCVLSAVVNVEIKTLGATQS